MNERLKSILRYSGVFLLGIIVGAFIIESLEVYVRPSYRDIILRTHLKTEQEFLASRSARENRLLEAAFHRWVVINTEAEDGFRTFRVPHKELDADPYMQPFLLLGLKWMWSDDRIKRGGKIEEGYDRGKLADALDSVGRKEEANIQWDEAQRLTHFKTVDETKTAVYWLLKLEATSTYRKAEDMVLGKE